MIENPSGDIYLKPEDEVVVMGSPNKKEILPMVCQNDIRKGGKVSKNLYRAIQMIIYPTFSEIRRIWENRRVKWFRSTLHNRILCHIRYDGDCISLFFPSLTLSDHNCHIS